MSYLIEKVTLDKVIKRAERLEAMGITEAADSKIPESERDLRCQVRDYLFSVHQYLKELKALKEKS